MEKVYRAVKIRWSVLKAGFEMPTVYPMKLSGRLVDFQVWLNHDLLLYDGVKEEYIWRPQSLGAALGVL